MVLLDDTIADDLDQRTYDCKDVLQDLIRGNLAIIFQ